ncbi:hypothetical protein PGT21_021481 [Puccinia graminis f. sp. tritici]|uniref:Uncharacterized protein n=1 Tax=Puccinia graminis f. sp. tritici TaxID=56615 RepID=A0A5B0MY41_PUCGR|nr:hypothetical protein PGT21_021481 [Puccinia graminis f. sp. tritici]KAA1122786.1 hypothetical protein PGTUg99_000847 [Puccinia graminis f. sp. tritici]KAA1134682.1 hypothetical protein PGTUg99_014224 [Puccinia graminis f. sp. tritici]
MTQLKVGSNRAARWASAVGSLGAGPARSDSGLRSEFRLSIGQKGISIDTLDERRGRGRYSFNPRPGQTSVYCQPLGSFLNNCVDCQWSRRSCYAIARLLNGLTTLLLGSSPVLLHFALSLRFC